MLIDTDDIYAAHDSSPWPAFADLLAGTTLLFLILFAVAPVLVREQTKQAKENTFRELSAGLAPDAMSGKRYEVDTIGDYLLIRIPEKATFPKNAFAISSFQQEGRAILREVATRIRAKHLLTLIDQIQVVGHTSSDSDGTDVGNWQLSSERATSVAMILIYSLGLPACQVTALGRGRFYPVDPDRARQSSLPNPADRRIELEIRPAVSDDENQKAQSARCVEHPGKPR